MPAKRSPVKLPVLVFVDYENIRRAIADNYPDAVPPKAICKALKQIASTLGEFRAGTFFGDWTIRPEDARDIESNGFKAELVLRTIGRKDRTDVQLAVEMMDAATRKETRILLLGAGDGDYKPLIRKAQERGKKVHVAAIGQSISRELLTLADGVVALEKHLGLNLEATAPVAAVTTGAATATPAERPSAGVFVELVRRLDRLQASLPYVTRNYFRDQLQGEFEQREALLAQALADQVITTSTVPNPKLTGRTVEVLRLNKLHPTVAAILEPKS